MPSREVYCQILLHFPSILRHCGSCYSGPLNEHCLSRYVKMNGSDYADLEQQPEYSNADTLLEGELTQSLLEHSKQPNKNTKNKFPYNRYKLY